MQLRRNKFGFTLIELSLAITFIGILSILVALIINNAISSYRRGMVLNRINTVGMDLVDDMRMAVQNSNSRSLKGICKGLYGNEEDCSGLVSVVKYNDKKEPMYGVFCSGSYSYLWNSGYFFDSESGDGFDNPLSLKIGEIEYEGFKLLKVEDKNRYICMAAIDDGSNSKKTNYSNEIKNNPITVDSGRHGTINGEIVDILSNYNVNDDNNVGGMAIYDLKSELPAESALNNNMFYSVSFVLGTVDSGADVNAESCTVSNSEGGVGSLDYCAINKFNFAAQALGV